MKHLRRIKVAMLSMLILLRSKTWRIFSTLTAKCPQGMPGDRGGNCGAGGSKDQSLLSFENQVKVLEKSVERKEVHS